MVAVLCCGDGAVLGHGSAAALLGFGSERAGGVKISVRSSTIRRYPGLRVHRRPSLRDGDVGFYDRIPVTSPAQTLIDLAVDHDRITVERMVDEADRLDLITPPELRIELESHPGQRGVARLRTWLDRRTFRLTRSRLERLFLPLARDHRRDQAHAVAGFTSLRFTHEQVRYEPEHMRAVLGDVARRLTTSGAAASAA
jgi:hypothetical protein